MTDVLQREIRHSLVPMVLEESKGGERAFDIYSMLLRQRIIFLGQEVDDQIANLIISQMLYLEAQDPNATSTSTSTPRRTGLRRHGDLRRDPTRAPGRVDDLRRDGDVRRRDGALRRSAGQAPRVTERAHHDPPGQCGARGAPSDMEIQLREALALTRRMAEIIAHHSGRSVDEVIHDIDRDYFMTADDAVSYGLIDAVIAPRRGLGFALDAADPPPSIESTESD